MCKELRNKKILNVCSSDEDFYKNRQPYIWKNLLKPLKEKNKLINLDLKENKGIDIVADCCNMSIIKDDSYDVVLFNSGIEHINEPKKALAEIKRVLKKEGFAIISAPGVYPKHNDPIDTMLRLPDKKSWKLLLEKEWIILEYKQTKPIKAKPFYNFNSLVYVTLVKIIKK